MAFFLMLYFSLIWNFINIINITVMLSWNKLFLAIVKAWNKHWIGKNIIWMWIWSYIGNFIIDLLNKITVNFYKFRNLNIIKFIKKKIPQFTFFLNFFLCSMKQWSVMLEQAFYVRTWYSHRHLSFAKFMAHNSFSLVCPSVVFPSQLCKWISIILSVLWKSLLAFLNDIFMNI